MSKFKTKSKTIIIFYHCFMKQKGSFTPEIETNIKKRIATPRKRVTCVCKWRNPLKAARPWEGFRNSWIQGHTQCHQYGGTFSLPLVISQLCSPLCWLAFQAFFLEMAVALEAPGFYLQTQRKGSRTLIQFFFTWPPWTNHSSPFTCNALIGQAWVTCPCPGVDLVCLKAKECMWKKSGSPRETQLLVPEKEERMLAGKCLHKINWRIIR